MTRFSPLVLLLGCTLASPVLLAGEDPAPCLLKSQEINGRIQQAKADGDRKAQADLQKTFSQVNAACGETARLKQQEQKVLDARREVSRRQSELNKAMAKGDPEHINQRKDKLAESRKALLEAQTQLEKVQAAH